MHASDFIDLDAGTLSREIFSSDEIFRRELERVFATPGLSKNTYEMVSKSLA